MDWLKSRSHQTQLVLTAASASLATAGAISAYNRYSRHKRRLELQKEVLDAVARQEDFSVHLPEPELISTETKQLVQERVAVPVEERLAAAAAARNDGEEVPEELFREQLARVYAVFKEEGMERIRKAKVAVVGCGGVGSWAAVMLVRSGITNIRLVDFDRVTLSSLNRHATATLADVQKTKVECIASALKRMSLKVEVDARNQLWSLEEGAELLEGMDFVIDAIDNITTKVDLLRYCYSNGIKVISSMGAGSKLDPTRIQISDISYTFEDSLSRAVRVRLRKSGIVSGIPVVYSTEQPHPDLQLLPLDETQHAQGNVHELSTLDDFRVRVIPVLGSIPGIFGLEVAAYVLCELAGRKIEGLLAVKNRHKTYERMLRELKNREEKAFGETINRLPIDECDVSYIYEDLYRGRSLIPPHRVPNKATLTRWDPNEEVSVQNCVVLDGPEFKKHVDGLEKGLKPEEIWGEEVVKVYEKRRKEAGEWWVRQWS